MNTWTILLAAGSGSRLARAGLGVKKQFLTLDGAPLFWRAAKTFGRVAGLDGLVFTLPPDEYDAQTRAVAELDRHDPLGLAWLTVPGGERRQDSVENALAVLPPQATQVLVHDSARCFMRPEVAVRVLAALKAGARAVAPGVAVTDTIKVVEEGRVRETPRRASLVAVQTPQGLDLALLRRGFAKARAEGLDVTDDVSLAEAMGEEVVVVEGAQDNVKITTPKDLELLAPKAAAFPLPRVGFGYDVHRYAAPREEDREDARPMVLGGAPIPGAPKVLAHSDGDVLLHALGDALLGCLCAGDIGQHFPDADPGLSGISSGVLISEILAKFPPERLTLVHVDVTVVAQTPRIGPHREHIRRNVAALLGLPANQVNVKATTEERLGFTGAKLGVKAYAQATALVQPLP